MRKILTLIFCISSLGSFASVDPNFTISIMDFSNSWTSKMHYYFDNDEMYIVEVDNVEENKVDTLNHRQLLGKEKDLIVQYLKIMSAIQFEAEYRDSGQMSGDRNQKRISISIGDEAAKSIFVSNTYQQDLAAFVTFLNSFISERYKMKEFVDPSKPKRKTGK